MSLISVFDNKANRPRPQFFVGYVSEDGGSVSSPTAVGLSVTDYTEDITYSASTKKITLLPYGSYEITVQLNQTGGSAAVDIYNSTDAAQVRLSAAAAGDKTLIGYVRTAAASKDIQIRVDDQSANGTLSTNGIVKVVRLGRVQV